MSDHAVTVPGCTDVRGAQEALGGISRSSLYELLGSGRLRSVKICGRRLIPWSAIEDLIGSADAGGVR